MGKILPIEMVSDKWADRKKTNLVKWLMDKSGLTRDDVSCYLGCSKAYLNNKITRDIFTFEDILVIAYACDYTLCLIGKDSDTLYYLDAKEFIKAHDEKLWLNVSSRKKKEADDATRRKYLKAKEELEACTAQYNLLTKELEAIEDEYLL